MSEDEKKRNVLQGYVTNRRFGNFLVPGTMQNLLLRDYCARNNLIFKLSVGEYAFDGCYMQLEGLFANLRNVEGVGMCSMFMLPKSAEHRARVYDAFIETGAAIHLLLEGIVVRTREDAARLEEVLLMNQAFDAALPGLPADLTDANGTPLKPVSFV